MRDWEESVDHATLVDDSDSSSEKVHVYTYPVTAVVNLVSLI